MDLGTAILMGVLIGFLVLMMFLQTRNRRRMVDEQARMIDRLRPGMRVKTVAGVIGRIREIREENATLRTVLLETGHHDRVSFVLYDVQAIMAIMDEAMTNTPVVAAPEPTPEITEAPATDFDAATFVEKSNDGRKPRTKK
ncbi:MAG: preprotein translocase subunit YajC [Firmicutes bacterium]|nr:preprotein translocase subunit YajC [Bacillota bacterium]